MGWVWREVKHGEDFCSLWMWEDLGDGQKPTAGFGVGDPVKKIVTSVLQTEKVKPGKFILKIHTITQVINKADGLVISSKEEDTQEDTEEENVDPFDWIQSKKKLSSSSSSSSSSS